VLVVLLAGVVVLVTVLAGPLVPRWHDPPRWLQLDGVVPTLPPQVAVTQPPAFKGQGTWNPPAWVAEATRGIVIAALAVVLFLLGRFLWRFVRDRLRSIDTGPATPDPGGLETLGLLDDVTQAALQEGVLHAGWALREDLPPGDAVVAAWLALEQAAGRGGIPRGESQTATEFTLALLDRTPADPAAARTLLGLYHRARFSDHEVHPSDVAAARSALGVLARALPQPARTTRDGETSS
jgi:hypothetical protein